MVANEVVESIDYGGEGFADYYSSGLSEFGHHVLEVSATILCHGLV